MWNKQSRGGEGKTLGNEDRLMLTSCKHTLQQSSDCDPKDFKTLFSFLVWTDKTAVEQGKMDFPQGREKSQH